MVRSLPLQTANMHLHSFWVRTMQRPRLCIKIHAAVGVFLSPTAGLKQVGNNQCSHEDEYSFSSTTSLYHRIVDWRNNNQVGEARAFEDHQARLLKSWSRYHKFIY